VAGHPGALALGEAPGAPYPATIAAVLSRPFVFVNMAMTADGKIDTVERRGARISGATDTARVDRLRADSDAIMVGGRTLLAEDPRLTVRDPALVTKRTDAGRPSQPMKVGVVSCLTATGDLALKTDSAFLTDGGSQVLLFTSRRTDAPTIERLQAQGAEVIIRGDERVDLPNALADLAERGVQRLMVEGGSTIVASLLELELVDELQLAIAPLLFGGATAPTPVGGRGWPRDQARALELIGTDTSPDGDVILRYRLGRAAAA
jgi:2,5-diamino-6-(ribosylamino)-4(3H)-pyrimidinone 5'-phosphate reductase